MSLALSVIIPAHNEGARLHSGMDRLLPVLRSLDVETVEVIIVDDGSSDDTGRSAAALVSALPHSLVVRNETNRGKGGALKVGIAVARGQYVVACDADMSIHPRHLTDLMDALTSSTVAVGTRARGGVIKYDSALRTTAGRAFNTLVRRWTGTTVRDTQCGFKGFHLGVARLFAIFGHIDGFAFDAEWLYLAQRLQLTATAVPVEWDDVAGSSVRVGRDSWRMLMDIRGVRQSPYRTVAVRIPHPASLDEVAHACRDARVQGAVLARGSETDIVVLPRDGAPGGLGIAKVCGGVLGVVGLDELVGRTFEGV
jgi:dolichyl-phosphate beta-glucosyltransferase